MMEFVKIGDFGILLTMCIPILFITGCANSSSQAVQLVKLTCDATDWPTDASLKQAEGEYERAPTGQGPLFKTFSDGRVRTYSSALRWVERPATAKELRAEKLRETQRRAKERLLEIWRNELADYNKEVAQRYESDLEALAKAARLDPVWDDILKSTRNLQLYYETRPLDVDGYTLTAEEEAQFKKAEAAWSVLDAACVKASS
jgi:hypothetical protein